MEITRADLTKQRYLEFDVNSPEQFNAVLVDKFFDEQVVIARLLIKNAILTGAYSPPGDQLVTQTGPDTIGAEPDVSLPEEKAIDIEQLPSGHEASWNPASVILVAEKTMALQGAALNLLRRKHYMKPHDSEDVISVARARFVERIESGKFPESLAQDDTYLHRLFMKFVAYSAVDHIRAELGRNGQKQRPVSLDAPDQDGEDSILLESITDGRSVDEFIIDSESLAFIKQLLPTLSERERRVLIMKGYFECTYPEIASITGSTVDSVTQAFRGVRFKAARLLYGDS